MQTSTPPLLKTRSILFYSFAIELLLFYFYYFPETKLLMGDEFSYYETGLSIAVGGDWHANPLWPPMQGLLIAFFAKVFTHPLLPLQLFQYLLLIFSGFIIKDIVYRETNNKNASQIGLAIMLLFPSWLAYSQYLWPEVIHVALFVAVIWINNYKFNDYKWLVISGFLVGLALLFKSLLVLFIPIFFLPIFIKLPLKKSLTRALLSLVITLIVIAPAIKKSHEMTGGWMVSNSSMFNLNLGLNDDTRQHFSHKIAGAHYKKYMASGTTFQQRNQDVKQKAMGKITENGYINTFIQQIKKQYFRLFDYQTFFTQQFNGDKQLNYLNKYHRSSSQPLVKIIVGFDIGLYFILFTTMLLGIIVSLTKSSVAQQFSLFFLYILGLFLLLHAIPRFRIPLVPLMAFYSAYFYHYLSRIKSPSNGMTQIKNACIALVVASIVAFCVFAGRYFDIKYPI